MPETTSNYIFRVHDDGASNIRLECWSRSSKLDTNKIRTIKDTLRKGSSKVATSVPTPFARMYLFDTAFKMVSDQLDGDSVYHQLVSDCLDVFQLLFNSGNANSDIKFKQWNRVERIESLKKSPEGHPHRLLATSLEMFFENKFSDVQDITLIYFKNILLGGTSPFTIFFTSPNWHREMEENGFIVKHNDDIFFDLDYKPLHLRDKIFREFLWKFYLSHRTILNAKCEGFASYIRNTIEKYDKALARRANDDLSNYINDPSKLEDDYQKINVIPNSSTFLQISNLFLYAIKSGGLESKIESESDILINSTIENYKYELDAENIPTNPNRPLVIAKGMTIKGTYTYDNTPWNPSTEIRSSSIMNTLGIPLSLSERYLPGNSQIRYPFITTKDFLEDNLIRVPYKINNSKFLCGYSGDFNFLLPIKKEYFNFFTKRDLKNHLEIIPSENKLTVKLKIPIIKRRGDSFIIFSKEYDFANTTIAQCKAGFAISPFYKVMDNDISLQKLNDYTVLFADKNDKLKVDAVEFWKTEEIQKDASGNVKNKDGYIIFKTSIQVPKPEPRTKKGISAASYYYKVDTAFDIIELKLSDEENKEYTGLIIPEFKEIYNQQATKKFTFAIDFGTSNSHIAYTEQHDDKKPKPFEVLENEMQMVLLNNPGESKIIAERYRRGFGEFPEIDVLVNREFIPSIIGKDLGSHVNFPIKTTTCEKASFRTEKLDLFGNINVGFFIDADESKSDNAIYQTNLKWLFEYGKDLRDPDRIKAFLKELIFLVKNKVLYNGGSIEDTQVIWLIPQSMKPKSIDNFATIWQTTFNEVFKGTCHKLLEPISESVAPYFYLREAKDDRIQNHADALNIDIGGGTTDVMFFMKNSGKYLSTSFRFAGNDIWGDGFDRNEKDNGFLKNLMNSRSRSKQSRGMEDGIFEIFMSDSNLTSEDVTSLLFHYDSHFKFSESINRDKTDLKLIFFLHYGAIIYHLIQIIEKEHEKKQVTLPRYFTFTGKGSQYINIMCPDKKRLNDFTELLLKAYSSLEIPNGFKVILTSNPKEATANGAALFVNSPQNHQINTNEIETVYHWGCETSFNENFNKNVTKIEEVVSNKDFNNSVLKNLQQFVEKTLGNSDIENFLDGAGITNVEKYKNFLIKGDITLSGELFDSYYTLIENLKQKPNDKIAETFFFLALKDSLYSLSKFIVEN